MFFSIVVYFLLWTFLLYWIHRIVHRLPWIKKYHRQHPKFINANQINKSRWEFNNLFLFNDDVDSTIDLWITEVIPTLIFCLVTGAWWIFWFYYIWASIFQEVLEHRNNLNLPWFTAGLWHLEHHKNYRVNFGLFFPIWDILFRTYKKV